VEAADPDADSLTEHHVGSGHRAGAWNPFAPRYGPRAPCIPGARALGKPPDVSLRPVMLLLEPVVERFVEPSGGVLADLAVAAVVVGCQSPRHHEPLETESATHEAEQEVVLVEVAPVCEVLVLHVSWPAGSLAAASGWFCISWVFTHYLNADGRIALNPTIALSMYGVARSMFAAPRRPALMPSFSAM